MPGPLTPASLSAEQWEIYIVADEGQRRVLGCILADWPSELARRVLRLKRMSPLVGILGLTALLLGIFSAIAWSDKHFSGLVLARLAVIAGLCGLCILLVKVSYIVLVPSIAVIAVEATSTQDAHVGMLEWFGRTFSLRRQLRWSILAGTASTFGLIAIGTLWSRGHLEPEMVLSLFVLFFLGGHCAYWGFTMPTYIERISRYQLRLFPLNPSQSWVVWKIWNLVRYAVIVGCGLVMVFISASFMVFNQFLDTYPAAIVMACWYVLAVIAALFLFFYSRGYLSVIIRNEKFRTLAELQRTIALLREQMREGKGNSVEDIGKALDLYERVRSTPETPARGETASTLITTLLIPSLPILTVGLDLWIKLQGRP